MTKTHNFISALPLKLSCFLLVLWLTSCSSSRNLTYFSDLQTEGEQKNKIVNATEPKIQPNDLLSISVSTLSAESNALFNSGILLPANNANNINSNNINNSRDGYLVDNLGNISFPIIGQVKLGGLTRDEATKKITAEVKRYIKGEPIVNLRYLNFKVTVLGEVGRPASINVPTERINVLEALSMAGDLTVFGKRENVLIIREKDGARSLTRLNLNSKESLNSPYFYLQQNDIVYVEPSKVRALQASTGNFFYPKVLGITSALALIFYRIARL
jgi:polysaccharide export outer membrane protein